MKETIEKLDYDRLLQSILDIGEEMVVAGAEVGRVEDSIRRMLEAYGCDPERINCFIITSNMQVTMVAPDGKIITQIRQIKRYSVNFDRLDYLNDLSRYVVKNKPGISELREKYHMVIERKPQPTALWILSGILIAGAFAIFFGGSVWDAAASALTGVFVTAVGPLLQRVEKNELVYNFVMSFACGLIAYLLVKVGFGEHEAAIMMGSIMLLIPGIALTNAIRDMLTGDVGSGMIRLVNALLVAAAVACGFCLSMYFFGGFVR